jgi:hypothetical protein
VFWSLDQFLRGRIPLLGPLELASVTGQLWLWLQGICLEPFTFWPRKSSHKIVNFHSSLSPFPAVCHTTFTSILWWKHDLQFLLPVEVFSVTTNCDRL